ncbi:MAG: hypothetical protein COB37_07160 [Kordiimonadales bacterium]|nr:MAG: hypothetical protein COB37_07160 [Kordiimonadales bacterium]
MASKITPPTIEWQKGVPTATRYGDAYYDRDNGLEECQFVFLDAIEAPGCWQKSEHFVIGETGFGTGLNFLATYQRWAEAGRKGRITFISAEAHPLSASDLARAHSHFPELGPYAEALRGAWPPPSAGFHHRYFEDGKIQLILLFGDAAASFADLSANVDAWFFDGFSPLKNPEIWSDRLFRQVARLSKPGTRFATFAGAGAVCNSLAAHGFAVQKAKGYGTKCERLVGVLEVKPVHAQMAQTPEWATLQLARKGTTTIIGAGIAGRSLAAALVRRGAPVHLISGDLPTASTVPAAILAPGFQAGLQPTTPFVASAFAHACWNPAYSSAWANERGVTIYGQTEAEATRLARTAALLGWGKDWLEKIDAGIRYPKSGSLDTVTALEAIYPTALITNAVTNSICPTSEGWIISAGNTTFETNRLVLASGAQTANMLPGSDHLFLSCRAGQVEFLDASTGLLPNKNGASSVHFSASIEGSQSIGSSFSVYEGGAMEDPAVTQQNTEETLAALRTEFGHTVSLQDITSSWAGIRSMPPDYVPYIGPVPNWAAAAEQYAPLAKDRKITGLGPMPYQRGLYVLSAFASKGYQQAPYAAEYLAAHLCGDPLPIAGTVARYLHPARSFIRNLIRQPRR